MIVHGDALYADLPACQLVYLDPPWFTQQDFVTTGGERAYSDKWKDLDWYLSVVSCVAQRAWEKLEPGCSLVVHVDQHACHYLKCRLDDYLDQENFASEIIWRYRRWPAKTPNFQRMHDVLYRYVKPGAPVRFTQLYEPLAASTRKQWGTGRQLAVKDSDGKRTRSSTTSEPSPGVPLSDVWEIPIIAPSAHERTGYPTQKPEALLERLILSLTHTGDLVVDPMCGSGSALAAAKKLGRRWFGVDKSEVAVRIANERCK